MSKVWLVTGAGNGLGRNITEAALLAGEKVVATARQPQQLQDLVQQYGETLLAVKTPWSGGVPGTPFNWRRSSRSSGKECSSAYV